MQRFLIHLVFLIFSTLALASSDKLPDKFQGTWRINCSDPDDLLVIQITDEQVNFWETAGDILRVEIVDSNNVVVELRLLSEGQEWVSNVEFQLNDGKLIQNPYESADKLIRIKCKGIS